MNNFNSVQRTYESLTEQSYNNTNPDEFIFHFLNNPYIETILNNYNEVKIGSLYFRFIDKNKTLIVGRSDYNKFISTRNQTFVNYNNDENVFLFDLSNMDISLIFNKSDKTDRASIHSMVIPDFGWEISSTGLIQFINKSFFDNGTNALPQYRWSLSNGLIFNQFEPASFILSENDLPLVCTLQILNDSTETNNITKVVSHNGGSNLACYRPIKICRSGFTISIDIRNEPWYDPSCSITWKFGDGTSAIGPFIEHTYSNIPGRVIDLLKIYEITGELICPNGTPIRCILFGKTSYLNNICNLQKQFIKIYDKPIGNNIYKIIARIWVMENLLEPNVGSSASSRVRYPNTGTDVWYPTKIITSNEGMVYITQNACCFNEILSYRRLESSNTSIGLNNFRTGLTKPGYYPNQFYSNCSIRLPDHTWFDSGEKLYLQ